MDHWDWHSFLIGVAAVLVVSPLAALACCKFLNVVWDEDDDEPMVGS